MVSLAVPATPPVTDVVEENPPLPLGRVGWIGQLSEDGPEETWWGDDLDDVEAQIRIKHPNLSTFDGSLQFGNKTKSWSDDILVEREPSRFATTATETSLLSARSLPVWHR
ncbi:hypothetical protein DL767_004931 [Monosporascus sp. MG133]|nr:hypothetical protein DL767_004931 [Monosporascus sp. MG133]